MQYEQYSGSLDQGLYGRDELVAHVTESRFASAIDLLSRTSTNASETQKASGNNSTLATFPARLILSIPSTPIKGICSLSNKHSKTMICTKYNMNEMRPKY